ncbi:hypothetical protein [Bradyrhizobium cenepequi]|uniref:hypothetical protein n=1 Tax=Bradyrhizobium cenepequi TaxID=2821403 RepID=UPI001CE3602E|nr:hypothetical protein [Bradyrhizobium cenepequi]MCA6105826.1 hypothetical protein [Bradyrhizobium cenepequi]
MCVGAWLYAPLDGFAEAPCPAHFPACYGESNAHEFDVGGRRGAAATMFEIAVRVTTRLPIVTPA